MRRGAAPDHDLVVLTWEPPAGTRLGAPLSARPNAAALAFDRVEGEPGPCFAIDEAPDPSAGRNWVRARAGLYHAQITASCRPRPPLGPEGLTVLFTFLWCGEPPIPGAPGIPGAPEVAVWRHQTIPPGLPLTPRGGLPLTESALVRVPEDGGHLCVAMGTSEVVETVPGDRLELVYVRLA